MYTLNRYFFITLEGDRYFLEESVVIVLPPNYSCTIEKYFTLGSYLHRLCLSEIWSLSGRAVR